MKKSKKILAIFLITLIVLSFGAPIVRAADFMGQATEFINKGKSEASGASAAVTTMTDQVAPVVNLLINVGAGIMVAVVTYMGIKYFTSSPDQQAKLKQQLIGVCVAGIVIFGGVGIWKIALNLASTFDGT